MRLFLIALQFLTIIPIRLGKKAEPEELAKSLAYFPLVGILLGTCLAVLEYFLTYFLPSSVVRLILVAFPIAITGGLHLDGLSDTVDAIASQKSSSNALKIMQEKTIGPVGASCVFIFLLARYVALGEFVGMRLYTMLLLFPMVGRMSIVTACFLFPYAKKEGKGKAFIDNATSKEFLIAGITSFLLGIILFDMRSLFIIGCVIFIVIFIGKYFTRKFGGLTGDTLGFFNEVGELVALIGGTVVL